MGGIYYIILVPQCLRIDTVAFTYFVVRVVAATIRGGVYSMAVFIREHGSILYLGMAKEIQIYRIDALWMKTAKEATNPQTKHANRMILPSISQKHSLTYLTVRGSR